jgi:hypothetical protein
MTKSLITRVLQLIFILCIAATSQLHAQLRATSVRDWPMPVGQKTGLSKPSFKILRTLFFENAGSEKHLILKMEIAMSMVNNPLAPFSYKYTFDGKEYTEKDLGTAPFSGISMQKADFNIKVQGPGVNEIVLYESSMPRKDLGKVPEDASINTYTCSILSLENISYSGTESIHSAITALQNNKPIQSNATINNTTPVKEVKSEPTNNPANTNSVAANKTVEQKTDVAPEKKEITKTQPFTTPVQPITEQSVQKNAIDTQRTINNGNKQIDPDNKPKQVSTQPTQETKTPATNTIATETKPAISTADANEAKAAYMLAEESYVKKDYRTALDYLQQVKTLLGTTNCKVLYLQIFVTRELNVRNPRASEVLLPLITEFEEAPDYKDFNEDKILAITKFKLMLKMEQRALKAKDDSIRIVRDTEAALEKAMSKILSRYPALDITYAELDANYPEMNIRKWKSNKTYASVIMSPNMDYDFTKERYPFGKIEEEFDYTKSFVSFQVNVTGVQKTFSYAGILVYTDKNINRGSVKSAMAEADAIIEQYTREMGKPTIPVDQDSKDQHYTVYRWKSKNKQLDICKLYYPKGDEPVFKLVEEIRIIK